MAYRLKSLLLHGVFVGELILFCMIYLFGAQGVFLMRQLQKDNQALVHQLAELKDEVSKLEVDIVAWNTQPFYKEKVAREQLQMARKDDVVIYID